MDGTIIQFLDGSHSYEGVWFGEDHPKHKGKRFWWRPILSEYFKKQIVDAYERGIEAGVSIKEPNSQSLMFGTSYYATTYNQK
jgi:hypothetical protein